METVQPATVEIGFFRTDMMRPKVCPVRPARLAIIQRNRIFEGRFL
jgi:hypothetical protein